MKNTLIQYVHRRGKPSGCLVAIKRDDGEIVIEYSLCRKTDKYDKNLGRDLAMERAMERDDQLNLERRTLPRSLHDDMKKFVSRCERYYRKPKTEMIGYI